MKDGNDDIYEIIFEKTDKFVNEAYSLLINGLKFDANENKHTTASVAIFTNILSKVLSKEHDINGILSIKDLFKILACTTDNIFTLILMENESLYGKSKKPFYDAFISILMEIRSNSKNK